MRMLDTPAEERFDRITRTARRLFGVSIALITLVDSDRQWFKSKQGLSVSQTPRSISFCGHAILSDELFIIPDATADSRFADNPLVVGEPSIRFYAGAPLHGAGGHRVGTLCIIERTARTFDAEDCKALRDLADWAEGELSNIRLTEALAALATENAHKTEFVSTIAHEVRTPLTSIRAALGLITSGAVGELPESAQNMLSIASRNVDRLSALVNDFLDSEKIAHGGMQFDLQPQALMPLLYRAMEDMQAFAQSYRVRIVIGRCDPTVVVNVDAGRFSQVLANLLSNAVKFSPSNALVEIGARIDGLQCLIEVRDRGPGIPQEFATRMFKRFAQADGSDARAKGGTGLGLAITKALVEGMGGTISHEHPASGGTKMVVALPLYASGIAEMPTASGQGGMS